MNPRRIAAITYALLLYICVIVTLDWRKVPSVQPVCNIPYFEAGQIIYPEVEGGDTLIVTNADELNTAMGPYQQGEWDASSEQLDSIFRKYCAPVHITYKYKAEEWPF